VEVALESGVVGDDIPIAAIRHVLIESGCFRKELCRPEKPKNRKPLTAASSSVRERTSIAW